MRTKQTPAEVAKAKSSPEQEEEEARRSKMSWQTYVDEHLMCEIEGQHLTSAAIVGHDGSVWAQSPNFPQVASLLISGRSACLALLRAPCADLHPRDSRSAPAAIRSPRGPAGSGRV